MFVSTTTYPNTKKAKLNSLTSCMNASVVGSATKSRKLWAKYQIIKGPTAPATAAQQAPATRSNLQCMPGPKLKTCVHEAKGGVGNEEEVLLLFVSVLVLSFFFSLPTFIVVCFVRNVSCLGSNIEVKVVVVCCLLLPSNMKTFYVKDVHLARGSSLGKPCQATGSVFVTKRISFASKKNTKTFQRIQHAQRRLNPTHLFVLCLSSKYKGHSKAKICTKNTTQ